MNVSLLCVLSLCVYGHLYKSRHYTTDHCFLRRVKGYVFMGKKLLYEERELWDVRFVCWERNSFGTYYN